MLKQAATTSTTVKSIEDENMEMISKIGLHNLVINLRKVVNHPFLITKSEMYGQKEKLITDSGKMIILDKMLMKLKEQGHKVSL